MKKKPTSRKGPTGAAKSGQPRTTQHVKPWIPLTKAQRDELRRLVETWVPPTKDERYRNARLAKRVRGL